MRWNDLKRIVKELLEELRSVIKGNTLDAILPPIIFVIVNQRLDTFWAIGISAGIAFMLGLLRIIRKTSWFYALGGFLGVVFASGLVLISGNSNNYFLPGIISSTALALLTMLTLVVRKPLAAWASHLSRGWKLEWFWRLDVRPAYTEVTWLWFVYLVLRTIIQLWFYQAGSTDELGWVNILLGLPVTIIILLISYVYGIWRLKSLKGPGIEEYLSDQLPPYKGQTKGF